ncbi:MAG TPA: hypothetical protein VH583_14425 [Vicinamibacterales bacterium]|jgi:hypothetical protein
MKRVVLNYPVFELAVATRAALGAGIGLLFAERMTPDRRRRVGMVLFAIGVAATVPVVAAVLRGTSEARTNGGTPHWQS